MSERGSASQKAFYSFGNFGNGVYNGLNNAIMGLFVEQFTSSNLLLGYLSNTRTMEGVVIQPLVGRWSDRSTNRLGRRRPFILFGIPIAVLCLAMIPLAGHTAHHWALPLIVASIICFSTTWNIAGDPYQALMIDITPERERSIFNSVLSVIALVGQVAIILYASVTSLKKNNIPDAVFYVCATMLLLSYALVFFFVKEPKRAEEEARREERLPLNVYIAELRSFREAMKLLISIFFLWTGLNAIVVYLTRFTKHVMHVNDAKALWVYLAVILSSALAAYPFGRMAARYGNRRLIVVGTVLMIAAAIGGTFAPSYYWLYPVAVVAGIGFSATTALTFPYLSQLVPSSKMGVFTGLQAAFSSVAVPLSVAAATAAIDFFGWRSLFVLLAVMMVFDLAFLLSIDEDAARAQVGSVEAEERAFMPAVPLPV